MDAQTLVRCTGARLDRAQRFAEPLTSAMQEYGIDTPLAKAAFLANVGHESGGLHWTSEIWGPTEAQRRYEGRRDLGNTQPGDGFKYRGRGLLQTTGRANYALLSGELGIDFIANPDQLAMPVEAALSAAYFWQSHALNAPANAGDFVRTVRVINGGVNGFAERQALYDAAKRVLGA